MDLGTIDRASIESRLQARIRLEVRLYEEHRLLNASRYLPTEVVDALAEFCEDLAGYRAGDLQRIDKISLVVGEVAR